MDPIIIAQILNFSLVVFILVYFGRKPFNAFLQTRSESVGKAILDAEKESKIVFAELADIESKISQQAAYVQQLQSDAQASLTKFKSTTLEHAASEATRIVREGELLGQGETLRKREALQREIAEKSLGLAKKFLNEQLEARDKERLVGEYVKLVGHGQA